MAIIAFPRVVPSGIDIKQESSVTALRSPYAPDAVQIISRGVSWWTGAIAWGGRVWDRDIDRTLHLDEITSFLDACEFGLHSFDIPLRYILKGRDVRFPTKDETTADNSVRISAVVPTATASSKIGLAAQCTLDTPTSASTPGLKRGDWVSLSTNNDEATSHRGAYRALSDQVGDKVLLTPAPPGLPNPDNRHRVFVREPTLRARLAAPPPAVAYRAEWHEPLIIQWEQSNE